MYRQTLRRVHHKRSSGHFFSHNLSEIGVWFNPGCAEDVPSVTVNRSSPVVTQPCAVGAYGNQIRERELVIVPFVIGHIGR